MFTFQRAGSKAIRRDLSGILGAAKGLAYIALKKIYVHLNRRAEKEFTSSLKGMLQGMGGARVAFLFGNKENSKFILFFHILTKSCWTNVKNTLFKHQARTTPFVFTIHSCCFVNLSYLIY